MFAVDDDGLEGRRRHVACSDDRSMVVFGEFECAVCNESCPDFEPARHIYTPFLLLRNKNIKVPPHQASFIMSLFQSTERVVERHDYQITRPPTYKHDTVA